MNILVAPNSMKGSIDAFQFADAVEEGLKKSNSGFAIRKVPVADGGDFTGEVLRRSMNGSNVDAVVKDPVGQNIKAKYAIAGEVAIIEMANASGIKLIKDNQLNPMMTSTFGTGQLIVHALNNGCKSICIGVGGSATVDGGTGMANALGIKLFDSNNRLLKGNGKDLLNVSRIELPENLSNVEIKIISDVDNPLLGNNGAAAVFGPQKGASPQMVSDLEKGLKNWCHLLEDKSGKKLSEIQGMGASGGIALPLVAFFNAQIVPGAEFILSMLDFDQHVQWADIVITGEGKIDSQTLNNKAPVAVARVCRKFLKPVVAIGGAVMPEASGAFDGTYSILAGISTLEDAMKNAEELIVNFSFEFGKTIQSVSRL